MTAAAKPSKDAYSQSGFGVRFDWGMQGATAISAGAAAVVVVDLLSFTTTLSVALDAGVQVFPYRFRDASAAAFAASRGAVLAVGRREAGPTGVSLSPVSVRRAAAAGRTAGGHLEVGVAVAERGRHLPAARRGRDAWWWAPPAKRDRVCATGSPRRFVGPIAVVAAGERWPGDALRPAVEDLWGAGLVIDALAALGAGPLSPEAAAARAAYQAIGRSPGPWRSAACASGRELTDDGYAEEIAMAAEVDVSRRVPVLERGFVPGRLRRTLPR